MHEIARSGNLALLNITSYQVQALHVQCLYSPGAPIWLGYNGVWRKRRDNVLMLLTNGAYAVFFASHILHTLLTYQYGHKPTNQPPVSSLIQQCRLKLFGHIARAAASCRGPLTYATRIHRSPPCWLAPSKRSISSALASKNRERSKTAQPRTTLCIATSDGSFFLAMHRGNGYAVRDCHLMMMMIMMSCHVVGAIEIQLMLIVDRLICWLIVPLTFPLSRSSLSRSFFLLMPASHKLRSVWCQKNPQWVKPYSWLLNDDRHSSSLSANASLCKLYIAP